MSKYNLFHNYLLKIKELIFGGHPIVKYLLVFGFFLFFFMLVYMKIPVLSSIDDHYFHFRFAENLIHNGFLHSFRDFKTIYFTGVAQGDHLLYYNFLFYIILIPFTFINPLFLAIKLYAIVALSLIGVIIYSFIKDLSIKYPFFWAVGFFSVIGLSSFYRLFLSRPFVFSPLIILLLIWAIHRKKYFWIFILSFIPLFWHTATFFVPVLVALVYFFVHSFYYKKYSWKEPLLVFLGTSLAVLVVTLIDHGFIYSIRDNLFSVLSGVVNFSGDKISIVEEGSEVYPKNFFDLFNQNILLCLMFMFSMIVYVFSFIKEISSISILDNIVKSKKIIITVLFVLSSIFLVAIPFISNRFTDFFVFFSWIFIALIFNEFCSHLKFTETNFKRYAQFSILFCLLYIFSNNALQMNDIIASNGSRPETFSKIGGYISKNLNKGDVVFNVTWNWFPQLYYYAPEQYYVIGLEPKLTYLYNPRLYWLWSNISHGYVCETEKCVDIENRDNKEMRNQKTALKWVQNKGDEIADVIVNDFKSHYIVSSSGYSQLNIVLNNSQRFERVVNSDNNYYVYKILPKL